MAQHAFFGIPLQPASESTSQLEISYSTDSYQLQQHTPFLSVQAAPTDQESVTPTAVSTAVVLSSAHDHPPLSAHAACSSNCNKLAVHHHLQQLPCHHPEGDSPRKHLHLLDVEHHTWDKLKEEENYLQLLLCWEKHLEGLVIPRAMEAFSTLCEIEHAFFDLTGVLSYERSNGRMRMEDRWENLCLDIELDANDNGVETRITEDRCLFEFVKMELKNKLKDNYPEYIQALRKEIMRKRKVGKLQGNTTILKKWWNEHYRWPYPTEQEKRKLVQETGLEERQINNWFINRRKRNWADRQPSLPGSAGSSSLEHLPCTLHS